MTLTNEKPLLEIDQEILNHVQSSLEEDMPRGDLTTDNLSFQKKMGHARMVAKQDLILSGSTFCQASFALVDHETELLWHFGDGEEVIEGQSFLEIRGKIPSLLKAERVALNYLGRFSGIASLTHKFAAEVSNTNCKILDTRKTTPLWRKWEKKAVVDGGGVNHRMNLSQAVMLKENHILASGGMEAAVQAIRTKYSGPIEIETRNLTEVKQAIQLKADRIMLDNMTNDEMKACLDIIPSSIETEASGNMSLERVGSVAALGVQFISVGALTHSAPCADISLLFDWTYE